VRRKTLGAGETRSVEDQTEKASCERTNDWNSDDPASDNPCDCPPSVRKRARLVESQNDAKRKKDSRDRFEVSVAERYTDGGTSDAHSSGDGKTVLGSENDSDSYERE